MNEKKPPLTINDGENEYVFRVSREQFEIVKAMKKVEMKRTIKLVLEDLREQIHIIDVPLSFIKYP